MMDDLPLWYAWDEIVPLNGWSGGMRITFVLPIFNLSGGTRVVSIYAHRLAARGHEVRVISPTPKPPTFVTRAKRLVRTGRWIATEENDFSFFEGFDLKPYCVDH